MADTDLTVCDENLLPDSVEFSETDRRVMCKLMEGFLPWEVAEDLKLSKQYVVRLAQSAEAKRYVSLMLDRQGMQASYFVGQCLGIANRAVKKLSAELDGVGNIPRPGDRLNVIKAALDLDPLGRGGGGKGKTLEFVLPVGTQPVGASLESMDALLRARELTGQVSTAAAVPVPSAEVEL